jgi:hypothetical protein
MKKLIPVVMIGLTIIFLSSCKKDEVADPNELGGETNVTIGQVGNTGTTSTINIGTKTYSSNTSFQIVGNDNGVATIQVNADLTKIPELQTYLNTVIPASMKDAGGKINTQVKLKMTSEGIQDFFNIDKTPHTIAKYDAKVGDEFNLTTSDGKVKTRSVVAVSTTDDQSYGFMLIKAITVEQNSTYTGIKKFIYKINHKFGLVYCGVVAEDGSIASFTIFPKNY